MSKFHKGQKVYCLKCGEGVVIETDNDTPYPIGVRFLKGRATYTADGIYQIGEKTPMLYASKPEITLPKWQPEPNQWCWFWDDIKAETVLRRFSMINGNRFKCNLGLSWLNCAPFYGELPEHLKGDEQ
jgi:hypothetical protein